MRSIPNKFAKKCDSISCNRRVEVSQGYAIHDGASWQTYHKNCVPDHLKPAIETKPKKESQVVLSEDEVNFSFEYNLEIINLIKTLPYEYRRFNSSDLSWNIKLNNKSKNVIISVCQSLDLPVPDTIINYQDKSFAILATEIQDKNFLAYKGLFDYQIEGVNFLRSKKHAFLGDDMGTGKTVMGCMALFANKPVMIICPSCVKGVWESHIRTWRKDYTPINIRTKEDFRLPKNGEVIIINRECLPEPLNRDDPNHENFYTKQFVHDAKKLNIIIDEAHKFKDTKSKGSKKVKSLSKIAEVCWIMTGTPILNHALDLWGVLSIGHMEREVFRDFEHFKECYNAYKGVYGTVWRSPNSEVASLLSKVRLARKKSDINIQLPKVIHSKMIVKLEDCENGSKIKKMLSNLDHEVINIIHKQNMLPPFNKFSEIRTEIAKARIPAMLEYVELCEENKVPMLVFSSHIAPLNALRMREGWGVICGNTSSEMRKVLVDNFQAGILHGLACTIEAGGVGLTMTRAEKALFVDLDWTPANNDQAEARIIRQGSKHESVEIIQMISDHAIDIHVHNLINEKRKLISGSLEITKEN